MNWLNSLKKNAGWLAFGFAVVATASVVLAPSVRAFARNRVIEYSRNQVIGVDENPFLWISALDASGKRPDANFLLVVAPSGTSGFSISRDIQVEGSAKFNDWVGRHDLPAGAFLLQNMLHLARRPHYLAVRMRDLAPWVDRWLPKGVPVQVPTRVQFHDSFFDRKVDIKPGKQMLHGNDFVAFMRFRSTKEADRGRNARQAATLPALAAAFRDQPQQAGKALEDLPSMSSTDLQAGQLKALMTLSYLEPRVSFTPLPTQSIRDRNRDYMRLDEGTAIARINDVLQGIQASRNVRLTVLNAGGSDHAGTRVSSQLCQRFGFTPWYVGNELQRIGRTRTEYGPKLEATASAIQEIIGGNTQANDHLGEDEVRVLVGGDR